MANEFMSAKFDFISPKYSYAAVEECKIENLWVNTCEVRICGTCTKCWHRFPPAYQS